MARGMAVASAALRRIVASSTVRVICRREIHKKFNVAPHCDRPFLRSCRGLFPVNVPYRQFAQGPQWDDDEITDSEVEIYDDGGSDAFSVEKDLDDSDLEEGLNDYPEDSGSGSE